MKLMTVLGTLAALAWGAYCWLVWVAVTSA